MSKIFYMSDYHLFHKNVTDEGTNFDNRPFSTLSEMHKVIKENNNKTVTNADHLYLAGDFAWKENEETIQYVSTLKGNKHLILGNHDSVSDQRYRQLFVEIVNYKEVIDYVDGKQYHVIVSHYPLAFWNHQHRYRRDGEEHKIWSVLLYGHVHNSIEEIYFQEYIRKLNEEYNIRCIAKNIGCMMPYMDYTPRTLKHILEAE